MTNTDIVDITVISTIMAIIVLTSIITIIGTATILVNYYQYFGPFKSFKML